MFRGKKSRDLNPSKQLLAGTHAYLQVFEHYRKIKPNFLIQLFSRKVNLKCGAGKTPGMSSFTIKHFNI